MHYAILACLAILYGGISTSNNIRSNQAIVRTEANAIAGSMMVYRNHVATYAAANPTVTGSVSDANLNLPSWYSRNSVVLNHIEAGKGYVYAPSMIGDLPYQVVKQMDNSLKAGIKISGNLINPLSTTNYTAPIVLPTAIPDGSTVIAH